MENKIPSVIARYDMLSRGDAVIVGTSGGADSMALLHWLFTHRDELGITVNACHINHNLRGEESLRDERFVRSFCEKLSIPLTVYSIEVITDKHESVEERARKMRYKCFDELCEKLSAKLATAHTASDNAETVLINILRGTGTKGLGGIPPVRGKIIRPLLRCTREDTESYCRSHEIEYVTDSTNLSEEYMRNKLRLKIIPQLKEFNPSLIDGISRMTEAVSDDNAFLERLAAQAKDDCSDENGLNCEKLRTLDRAVLSRIISSVLTENGVESSALRINECSRIIGVGRGKINLCRDKFAVAKKNSFRIITLLQNYRNKST